ncbi:MAG: type II secretion system F family protein [Verrucomicrobia bacterium]|jgi:type IV pilus assembly protein PilC|nr:type II secretion system F family protein [Verrucomicrobiota bacterium]MBT5063988.1 type II secretion system F family protein [Verrucomicrobiota bacterium]MBT5479226.1 type II secretion system F family protein [Verrucomicrobiota bacterium]MBT6238145.1 type II secretion system F family protein [Verrucomicrobiota bacterium]MBT7537481.1 type II secretion system F family protein [Verrucomicrobiota bacterium]
MPKFNYVAMNQRGKEEKGTLDVASQNEAINRLKDMGFFPTKVTEAAAEPKKGAKGKKGGSKRAKAKKKGKKGDINIPMPKFLQGKVKPKVLTTFTRQLATLVDAGLPLLRGLRVLGKQERNPALKGIIEELAVAIEGGSTFSEGLAQHPKTFNKLFINMVKAGEMGGVLEVVLNRLSEFMEKAEKIKGKVIAAMFYPAAVMVVAGLILLLLMVVVVPKFKQIFADMLEGEPLPGFTQFVMGISDTIKDQTIIFPEWAGGWPVPGPAVWTPIAIIIFLKILAKTKLGSYWLDFGKLKAPVVGPLVSKVSISRFSRTLGTLVSSGVPILQALTIVRETSGNMVVARAVTMVHESVKEGDTITLPLETSKVFPPMVISMIDVGEQTGALPEMLMRIADNYDEEVDNAVAALTSLLEPIMIVFLAVIVGSIVIALFLPLIALIDKLGG